ncbi:MAG TPA: hypothetical protein VFH27_11950 [Longimicrobiaceae bacterium]|nr:hypothetical protein [Longimicrobiaceae bacterium]
MRYEDAREFYRHTRRGAFACVRDSLVGRGILGTSLSLSGIDPRAVDAWERTWRGTAHWSLKGGFHWAALHRRYCRKPRNFHCAVWYGEELCGLAVGKLSEAHEVLCLHYMEGNPDPDHPLRGNVADIVFACAHLYAVAVDSKCILLKDPDPALEGYYAGLGFGLAYVERNARYCRRDL